MADVRRLNVKRVRGLVEPGRYFDGEGLYLQVLSPSNRSWLLRCQLHGKERWLGLGVLRCSRLNRLASARRKPAGKMYKAGTSLRGIAEDTSLGLRTVRTIIGRINRNDRTSKKRWERIQLDKAEQARWKRQKRTGDALPRRAQAVVQTGHELVKEAKGLGRGKR